MRSEREIQYLVDRGGLIDPKTGKRIYSPNQLLKPGGTDNEEVKLKSSPNHSDQVGKQTLKGED